MPVIVAGEAQHERPFGEGARDAQRAHHRLGSGAHEAQTLQRGQVMCDPRGEPPHLIVRRAEDAAARRQFVQAGNQRRMSVAEQERPVRHHVVDVAAPLDVVGVRAGSVRLDERRPADGRPGAHRGTRSTGEGNHARKFSGAAASRLHPSA